MRNKIYFIQIFWDLISVLVTAHIQNRNCDPLLMGVNHLTQCFCKQMESGFAREDFFFFFNVKSFLLCYGDQTAIIFFFNCKILRVS